MAIVSWIGMGIGAVIAIVGTILCVYYRRKLRSLDGFEGFERNNDKIGIETNELPDDTT